MNKYIPLAEKMRPDKLENFIGQKHIIGENSFLANTLKKGVIPNMIFFGPPGVGKTTLSYLIANNLDGNFIKINAVTSGVSDVKKIIENAKALKSMQNIQTYLLIDECHRWSKAQSDSILEASETGDIIFIGSTTENPFISMNRAIISRCKIFEFKDLKVEEIEQALNRAINIAFDYKIVDNENVLEYISKSSYGDLRNAYNTLEFTILSSDITNSNNIVLKKDKVNEILQSKAKTISETDFYDFLSAFCKSLRGSDSDAAIYYAHKIVKLGYDPLILARRLVIHSAEDIGLAASNALNIATSAMYACEKIGLPECMIPLTEAIIYICESPKSNSVIQAINRVKNDLDIEVEVPNHLKNHPVLNSKREEYKYPHDFGGYVDQQYLPDKLKNKEYYIPLKNGNEKNIVKKQKNNKNIKYVKP